LRGHRDYAVDVDFSPDGTLIVSAGYDSTVRVWEVETGKELVSLTHPSSVETAKFNAKGTQIVTAGDDSVVRVWGLP